LATHRRAQPSSCRLSEAREYFYSSSIGKENPLEDRSHDSYRTIGGKLAKILLDRKADVTVITRHPEKVDLADRGTKVIVGEHDNASVLEQAVRGADALFWVTPPALTSRDPIGHAHPFADVGASVIQKHPELHVVQISSVGAHLPSGTGPIAGLHYTEEKFRAAGENFVALRPNSFMENIFNSLHSILTDGNIYTSVPGSTTAPQIATRDIAEITADLLLSPVDGHRIVDIVGPDDISFDRAAEIIGHTIGKTVRVVTVPADKLKIGAIQAGLSPQMADLFVEMEAAFAHGMPHEFRGDEKRTGKITYAQFVSEVLVPAYKKAAESAA
jgi:uncharacterized protein YbjT (DUF2867 family)